VAGVFTCHIWSGGYTSRGGGRAKTPTSARKMESIGIRYEFSSEIWKYDAPAGWHFVSLPKDFAKEIRENLKWQEEGWGRLKAVAKIGNTEWKTAIWFDTKMNTYLLPLKAEIRKKEHLESGDNKNVIVWV
jgi:hypothetical protein